MDKGTKLKLSLTELVTKYKAKCKEICEQDGYQSGAQ